MSSAGLTTTSLDPAPVRVLACAFRTAFHLLTHRNTYQAATTAPTRTRNFAGVIGPSLA
jgi:hypothetical protein